MAGIRIIIAAVDYSQIIHYWKFRDWVNSCYHLSLSSDKRTCRWLHVGHYSFRISKIIWYLALRSRGSIQSLVAFWFLQFFLSLLVRVSLICIFLLRTIPAIHYSIFWRALRLSSFNRVDCSFCVSATRFIRSRAAPFNNITSYGFHKILSVMPLGTCGSSRVSHSCSNSCIFSASRYSLQ